MRATIYIGIGSNIGDRAGNIISALSFLQSSGFVDIKTISRFYETSPIGPKQRKFYNIAVKAETKLNPQDLLILIKQAERLLGRKRSNHWGARLIDIDILFYSNKCGKWKVESGITQKATPHPALSRKGRGNDLIIPHEKICDRLFVLVPLASIAPNLNHPVFHRKIKQILKGALLTLKGQKVKIVTY